MGIESYEVQAYDFSSMKASDYGLNQSRSYSAGINYSANNSYQINNCGGYN